MVFLNGHCLSLGNRCYSVLARATNAVPDTPFRTQLLPEVLEVKWIVVLLNRYSKFLTDSVREKANLSFAARRFFKSSVNFSKIFFEIELYTEKKAVLTAFSSSKG